MKEYNMLAYFKGKLNLYEIDDMDVEEFRDVIYDNFDMKALKNKGQSIYFGNECELEAVSHNVIPSNNLDSEFKDYLNDQEFEAKNVEFVHSKLYLHTQAYEYLKIDVISCIILSTDNVAYEIGENLPVALYYEEGDDDYYKEPDKDWEKNTKKYNKENSNFDPRQNEYWDEWLVDFGIKS
jgi:hypothetical protein